MGSKKKESGRAVYNTHIYAKIELIYTIVEWFTNYILQHTFHVSRERNK
jgi:hypothetical protein